MKAFLLILLCAWSSVHAEPAPVVDNSVYPEGAAPVEVDKVPSNNALYQLMERVEQLQKELQQLTGKVDEQSNTIAELKKRQKTMYADFDERLQSLETKAAGTAAPATVTPEATPEPAATTDEVGKTADTPAPATAEPAPVPEKAKPVTEKPEPAKETPPPAKPKAEAPQAADEEKQSYQQAADKLRGGYTSEAIAGFTDYLNKYPSGNYVSSSQYWLGEAYRVSKKTDAALKVFNTVIDKYPKSSKVPDALLKLGYIALEQKNKELARDYLNRVAINYPNTKAAQLAAEKLLSIK